MATIAANVQVSVPLRAGLALLLSGTGTAQALAPASERSLRTVEGGNTTVIGPFAADCVVQLRGGPLSYGYQLSGEVAPTVMIFGIADLDRLAQLQQLDTRVTYVDSDTGVRYVATSTGSYAQLSTGSFAVSRSRTDRISAVARGPIIAPAAWAAATAYTVGQARRLANGQILVCAIAGTSGGAEPTGFLDGRPITDNTVTWYVAPWSKSVSDPGAPTITSFASAGAAGLTFVDFTPTSQPVSPLAAPRGARLANISNVFIGPYTFAVGTSLASGNATAAATGDGQSAANAYQTNLWGFEVAVVADRFGFVMHNGTSPLYIEVDGQPLTAETIIPSGASGQCIVLDFIGNYRRRVIRVTGIDAGTTVQGMALNAQSYIDTAPAGPDSMLVLGDSIGITQTVTALGLPHGGNMTFWLERYLGIDQAISTNVGGSGYVSANPNLYNVPTVLSNAANQALFAGYAPRHILHTAGFNDRVGDRATAMAAALATWRATRSQFPGAKITIIDLFPAASGPDANALSFAADIRNQFLAWGDQNSRFIQVTSTAAATSYMTGTGLISAALTTGNSSLFSGDPNHLGPGGTRYMAQRLATAIAAAWNNDY